MAIYREGVVASSSNDTSKHGKSPKIHGAGLAKEGPRLRLKDQQSNLDLQPLQRSTVQRNDIVFRNGRVNAKEILCIAQIRFWAWIRSKNQKAIFSYYD